MIEFKKKVVDLGTKKSGGTYTAYFEYTGEGSISNLKSGCSCSTPKWIPSKKHIVVSYTASIPKQITADVHVTSKTISAIVDGKQIFLTFKIALTR